MTRMKLKQAFSQMSKKEISFCPVGYITGKVTITHTPQVFIIFWGKQR